MRVKVSEVAVINRKSLGKNIPFDNIIYLDTGNITDGKIGELQTINCAKDKVPSRAKRMVQANTIVYSTVRPRLKHYGILLNPSENFIVSTGFVTIDALTDKINPLYLYYQLIKNNVTEYLATIADTAVSSYPSINPDDIAELELDVIPLEEQNKIASILFSIENKININDTLNCELESFIKTLYDYWFLQFDFPNKYGKPYKSSGDKMIWSEELKQEIPDGWSLKYLSDISEMQTKSITPSKETKYQHYSIPAFDDTGMPIIEYGSQIDSNKYRVPSNSILVSKLNPQFKRLWNVGEVNDNCICSTEFLPFLSLNNQKEYLYSVLNSASFHKYMVQSSSSSTGSRKRMQPELCMEFKFASPADSKLIDDYCEKVSAALDRIIENKKENQELASLRDFLLPLLMNGQVTFKEN